MTASFLKGDVAPSSQAPDLVRLAAFALGTFIAGTLLFSKRATR